MQVSTGKEILEAWLVKNKYEKVNKFINVLETGRWYLFQVKSIVVIDYGIIFKVFVIFNML